MRAAAATLAVDGVTAEAVGALDEAGIPSLLLKGPAVAAWLYPPAEVRRYTDVDLLVPAGCLAAAEEVLAGRGFRYVFEGDDAVEAPAHARTWLRGDDPAVDLHTGLRRLPAAPDDVWEVLSEGAGTLAVASASVRVP